jgi:hypothetical protein
MKNLLPFIFCGLSIGCYSQVNTVMPPEADLFYNNAIQTIKPQIKNAIEKNANNLKGKKMNPDSLSSVLRADRALKGRTQQDIEAITILIMIQVSKNADADLKELVMNIQKNNSKDSSANNADSINVENILNNKSEIAAKVSLLMKKLSISQNIVLDHLRY